MKKLLLPLFAAFSITASAQNTLLKSPAKGNVPVDGLKRICFVANGSYTVLVAGNDTCVYALDVADNDKSTAAANAITSIPSFVSSKLVAAAGEPVYVKDMAVNPLSHAVYVLAQNLTYTKDYLFKVVKNGATVSAVDLSNISYSKLTWANGLSINDMTFGNGTLYVSSGSFSLDGELGMANVPFTNNTAFTKRATTMFKSNWGGNYQTTAPLETIAFGTINGVNRLMGVTTCAPGFSIEAAKVPGSGVLSVTEDFNIHFGFSAKVVYMYHDKKDWLFDLHDNNIYRIGTKYLDGSQVAALKYNNTAVELRDDKGNIKPAYPADDIKLMSTGPVRMMAYWDSYRMLVLEEGTTGALKLQQMSVETPPATNVDEVAAQQLGMYPNPATGSVTITLPQNAQSADISVSSVSGKVIFTRHLSVGSSSVDISNLAHGLYIMQVHTNNGSILSGKLTVE